MQLEVLPIAISFPVVFPWISAMVWNLFPFKGDFSFGKSPRAPNLGCRGMGSPRWFDVLPKNFAQDVMHEWAYYLDEAAHHQLPIAAAFWIIWIVSTQECSSECKIWCRFVALLSHFECDGHPVHMLTQWRLLPPLTCTVKSSLFMYVHSSPLSLAARLHPCHTNQSCYINNGWAFSGQTFILPFLNNYSNRCIKTY